MLRHVLSALFFVLLSFLMVKPSASTAEIDQKLRIPFSQKDRDHASLLDQTLWPGVQCHQNVGPMVLSFKNLAPERLYCALENELHQQRWSWSQEREPQNTMSSL